MPLSCSLFHIESAGAFYPSRVGRILEFSFWQTLPVHKGETQASPVGGRFGAS
jgi:hypothetical protein